MARSLPTGGQGSKVYVLCAEPKEHKHFGPGTRLGGSGARPGGSVPAAAGRSVTGVTEKLLMFHMFMCLVRPLPTLASVAADRASEVQTTRETLQGGSGMGCDTAL